MTRTRPVRTSSRRLAVAVCLMLSLVACGEGGEDPRVQRLSSDLAIAEERIAVLERRLAEASSVNGERTALRESLAEAEARIAALETPEGLAGAAAAVEGDAAQVRAHLVAATRALRAADGRLAGVARGEAAEDAAASDDAVLAASKEIATAADDIVAAASQLGLEIIGLAR